MAMSGFSAEELAGIPDDGLVDAVLGVVVASSMGREPRDIAAILDASPEGFGIVHSVWLLDGEVRNGGFHQYFWNHGHAYVEMTQRSLARLGAGDHRRLFEEACRIADIERPASGKKGKRAAVQAFSRSAVSSPLNALDARWYDLPEVGPILVAFVRQNPLSVWEED
jgi:hypothetical protein